MIREGKKIKNKKKGTLIIVDGAEWWEKEERQRIRKGGVNNCRRSRIMREEREIKSNK